MVSKHCQQVHEGNTSILTFCGIEKVTRPLRGGDQRKKLFNRESYWIYCLNMAQHYCYLPDEGGIFTPKRVILITVPRLRIAIAVYYIFYFLYFNKYEFIVQSRVSGSLYEKLNNQVLVCAAEVGGWQRVSEGKMGRQLVTAQFAQSP